MSARPLAAGSQPRKWSNDRFSIMSTTTCSTPFEPSGVSVGAALATACDRNSDPVRATPVDAPMSWRNVRRVSMKASMGAALNARQALRGIHSCRIRRAVTAWFPAWCAPLGERGSGDEWPAACLRRLPVQGHLRAGGVGDKGGAEQVASGPRAGLRSGQNALGCFGGDAGRCADAFTGAELGGGGPPRAPDDPPPAP